MSRAKGKITSTSKQGGDTSHQNKQAINRAATNQNKMYANPPVQKVSVASTGKKVVSFKPAHLLFSLARKWRAFLVILATIILGNIIGTLFGFSPIPESAPLATAIDQHPIASLVIGGILLAFTSISLIVKYLPEPQGGTTSWSIPRSVFSTALPIISSTLFIVILTLVLLRPPWCPTAICPSPQTTLIFHQQDIHDNNLDMYFAAQQSATYVIPGDPAHYTQDNPPKSIGALHTDGQRSDSFYHLIIGLQSLQKEGFGMIIEEVDLVFQQISPIPHPLNVWNEGSSIHYNNENEYRVLYYGQVAGAVTPAIYLRYQNGFVHLNPEETDQIDLHIVSRIEANVFFSVQVTYRVDNESQLHTLTLPKVFEVMFANQSDWHLYQFKAGHFVESL